MGDYELQNWCMNESTILVKSPHPKLSFVATNSHADFHYKLIKIKTEFKKNITKHAIQPQWGLGWNFVIK